MSHFTEIKTKIYDLNTLLKSLNDIDPSTSVVYCKEDGQFRTKTEVILMNNDQYEAGFRWNGAEYELVVDLMTWSRTCTVKNFVLQLNQRYAYNTIQQLLTTSELRPLRLNKTQNGSIKLDLVAA